MSDTFDLARLLHPIAPATFLTEHWDKRPLLVQRNSPDYYRGLFSSDDLDPLLVNYGATGVDDLRLAKRNAATITLSAGDTPNVDRIYSAYRDGYTLNINDFTPRHPAIRRMVHSLFAELGLRPRPNLFLTPPRSRAFDLHFDPHDLLIVQLGGAKEWRVYAKVEEQPTHEHSDGSSVAREEAGPPLVDTVLEAGDVLYIPRGFVHEAYTGDRHSLHVTVGLKMATYLELLQQMVESVGWTSMPLRQSIPVGAIFGRSRAELIGTMLDLMKRELTESLVDDACANLAAELLESAAPVESPRFTSLAALDVDDAGLELDSLLMKPPGLVASVRVANGRAAITVQGASVDGPLEVLPALEHVMRTAEIRPCDFPGGLSDATKLALAKRLVRAGVLRPGVRRD